MPRDALRTRGTGRSAAERRRHRRPERLLQAAAGSYTFGVADREAVTPPSQVGSDVLSWRVPPYQAALLILFVSAVAALNIYGSPSAPVRTVTLAFGAVALGLAVVALRMYLVVDDDGIAVRHILRQNWLPWSDIARVDVVSEVRGAATVRLTRADGTCVDVPPSLLQPSKPTSKPRALARLNAISNQIEARRNRPG